MNACHCVCALHRSFSTTECTGRRDVAVSLAARPHAVPMCKPCADWWKDSDPTASAVDLQVTWSDLVDNPPVPFMSPTLLADALVKERDNRGVRSNRELCRQAGVHPNTIALLAQGRGPDATRLVRLLLWLGNTDLAPFIRYEEPR